MDPDQAMIDFMELMFSSDPADIATAVDKADGLLDWRARGGCPPDEQKVLDWMLIRAALRIVSEN